MENIQQLIKLLQSLISPVVLISGVGLLLLSFTNRFGRVIDRSRILVKEIEEGEKIEFNTNKVQISILYKRSRILRSSITLISFTILFAGLMILLLFFGHFAKINIEPVFIVFFILAVIGLILAMILFLLDIALSLKALKLQVKDYL